jgi:flagellar biosynthesis protein FlhF
MRIKKFVGATLQEATGQMKNELGADAIILNTRTVPKGGLLNFLGGEMFEITAAVDDGMNSRANSYAFVRDDATKSSAQHTDGATAASSRRNSSKENALEGLAEVAKQFEQRRQQKMQEVSDFHLLKSEVDEIKVALREIAGYLKYSNMPSLPDAFKQVYTSLIEHDVDGQLASDLVQSTYLKRGENAIDDKNIVERDILDALAAMFKTAGPVQPQGRRTRISAFVGPTGVGKTTTIAKLAALSKLSDGLAVALISADTYRIGAIEQLHTFAAIADIPMEVVYKPSEMEQALRKFGDKDIVYIDTVGRSHYKKKEIMEVARFVGAADPDEVHLVLSASTHKRTLLESIERFNAVRPNRIVITKVDEAASFGSLLSLARQHPLPISFVATGQAVPDDIVAAKSMDLALMVYRGVLPHA